MNTLALLAILADSTTVIRVNQVGYLPDAPKVAVVCSTAPAMVSSFVVRDSSGTTVFAGPQARDEGRFGPCAATQRLDFTSVRGAGRYQIAARVRASAGARVITSPWIRIGPNVYAGAADTLLYYLRQQRSGFNPLFRDSVHKLDGYVIDDTGHVVKFLPVSGGWADASDYLQYVTTTATATFDLLAAYRDHPRAFADGFDARGLPGSNGVPDVLDEARHGLEWLSAMFPSDTEMYNQLGDDRDHMYFDMIVNDSADYGWGKGKQRPVYPCTGRPQGISKYKNRSTGYASTAGKFAAAFALGSMTYGRRDSAFALTLRHKALASYALGLAHPGVCQTASAVSPYFYEEDSWTDDMELGAAEVTALIHGFDLTEAFAYAAAERVTPWMGADTANHYQWYPWFNRGHYEIWRIEPMHWMPDFYREGIERVVQRAGNGFRSGIPFIWCSNDLTTAFATQALHYREMTGDVRYREYEQAAIDWLFGVNPWGTSMVIGYPHDGTWPHDPHSVHAHNLGVDVVLGGLVDGPVYRSIYGNLRGIQLLNADEYAAFNTGFIVYHDDLGDYSTNEPIMDGTASLAYLLSALVPNR
jgi:endoglucanase